MCFQGNSPDSLDLIIAMLAPNNLKSLQFKLNIHFTSLPSYVIAECILRKLSTIKLCPGLMAKRIFQDVFL